jgi:hypothetical protein
LTPARVAMGWDNATIFNIHAVDTGAGTHTVLREGHLAQP